MGEIIFNPMLPLSQTKESIMATELRHISCETLQICSVMVKRICVLDTSIYKAQNGSVLNELFLMKCLSEPSLQTFWNKTLLNKTSFGTKEQNQDFIIDFKRDKITLE